MVFSKTSCATVSGVSTTFSLMIFLTKLSSPLEHEDKVGFVRPRAGCESFSTFISSNCMPVVGLQTTSVDLNFSKLLNVSPSLGSPAAANDISRISA